VDTVRDTLLLRTSGSVEIEPETSEPAARNSDHYTTEAVLEGRDTKYNAKFCKETSWKIKKKWKNKNITINL
jgi:hypothetical protein